MPKLKVTLPVSGGINTQADPIQHAKEQLRNARNAFYKRDDQTLRRRPDLTAVGSLVSQPLTPQGCVCFEDTNKTFRKFVFSEDAAGAGTLAYVNIESPGAITGLGLNQMGTNGYTGLRRPVQYNNVLYWPSIPDVTGSVVGTPVAWNGLTTSVREAGVEIQHFPIGLASIGVNVAGAGALTFTTGRTYAWTLYDPTNDVESMPANNGSVLTTANTGVISSKGPVVTVTFITNGSNFANPSNNHTQVRFYATTDGGVTYYRVATATISPDANTAGATASFTDSTLDTALVANDLLQFNSPPPPAVFMAKFENKLVAGGANNSNVLGVAGEQVVSNVLYYSLTDEPEHWPRNLVFNTSTNAIPFKDQDGEVLLGAIQVNRVLLVGLEASVWTINHLPILNVDPLFDFSTLKDRVTNTHGFVSPYCYESLRLTDDEDAVFYVSKVGFHLNNGQVDRPVSPSLKWDSTVYNSSQLNKLHVINDTTNYIIIVGFASVSSSVVDAAYVYHYHPSHLDEQGIGKVSGPWDYNVACSTLSVRANGTKEVWGITSSATADNNVVKLNGSSGYDYNGSAISFEWETGWLRLSDDASARLRELNFTVEEADAALLTLGSSSLAQVAPRVKFLQLNSSGPVVKVQWSNDSVDIKQVTGGGSEIQQNAGSVSITSTDRAIVSATLDVEVYGEEKVLSSGVMVAS